MTTERILIEAALAAKATAYCPYSHYPVGAAIRTADGTIFTGCNVENASYGTTICAERTAATQAVHQGHRQFTEIAIATSNGGSPCGICRQFLYEFSPDLRVMTVDEVGGIVIDCSLSELLPHGFGPQSLPDAP